MAPGTTRRSSSSTEREAVTLYSEAQCSHNNGHCLPSRVCATESRGRTRNVRVTTCSENCSSQNAYVIQQSYCFGCNSEWSVILFNDRQKSIRFTVTANRLKRHAHTMRVVSGCRTFHSEAYLLVMWFKAFTFSY